MEESILSWYSKELGNGMAAQEPSNKIMEEFLLLFAAKGNPVEMAVFSHYDRHADVVTAYFSPGAKELAERFAASPCKKPTFGDGTGLLVGDQRAIQALFPETQGG